MDNGKVKIEMKDLMVLSSYRTLKDFDTSNIHYHMHDNDGLIEEISEEFKKQFKENLIKSYNEELTKMNLRTIDDHQG